MRSLVCAYIISMQPSFLAKWHTCYDQIGLDVYIVINVYLI